MRLAQIADGVVVNVIEVDAVPEWAAGWPEAGAAAIGWMHIAGELLPPAPPPPAQSDYRAAVQAHIDATAAVRGYDSGQTCATYVSDPLPQWAAEAAAFVVWRSAVWQQVLATLAAVAGGDPAPTIADLIAGLPAMMWPTA